METGLGRNSAHDLSERQAVEGYLASRNRVPWRIVLGISTVASVVSVPVHASAGDWLRLTAWALLLAGLLGIAVARRRPTFGAHARTLLLAHLLAQMAVIALTITDAEAGFGIAAILFPTTFLFFRFRGTEILVLAATTAGVAAWLIARVAAGTDESWIPLAIVSSVWIGSTARLSHHFSSRGRSVFISRWREQTRFAREHRRMRGELDDARAIQLGMLPTSLPELPWVDASAICLPATEVGGDYYDFLVLEDGCLAVVIADVAGHGMSSGLVLASLRGGLYLLRDELDRPISAVERLGRMLRSTTGRRMFVTFQLAILDPKASEVNVVSAGHPPLIVADSLGRVHLVGKPALPLGTVLSSLLVEDRHRIEAGAVLVLYSDGLVEAANGRGEVLGHDRLAEEVGRLHRQEEARLVRDGLLGRIASFKGDAAQEDDMTIVALRFRGGG